MSNSESLLSMTPHLPTYAQARAFLRVMTGVPYVEYRSMYEKIIEQIGNPKETVDWTDPEEWIAKRLSGVEQSLAFKIWRESNKKVNPRHTRGSWYLCKKHNLLVRDGADRLQLSSAGQLFLNQTEGELTAEIDRKEGLLTLLQIVSEHSPGKRGEILPEYIDFCNTHTTYHSLAVHKSSLYARLMNLIDRGFIRRSGVQYEITEAGIQHLAKYATVHNELRKIIQSNNNEARKQLFDYLAKMDPYKFEHLVRILLEEMGYTDIEVTPPSNDKGVDVVASIELGISSIREVVQVKRHTGSINRTVIDQLRGSLHRFKAFRGTIITTGSFSAGAKNAALEQGVAPITLIDGEKLLDLLIEYGIGVSKKTVEYYEFDDSKLNEFEEVNAPLEKEI